MKQFYSFITSISFMAFLLLALAFSMAIATFVESSYGTTAARALIYNAIWFELLWALFALNLVDNIFRYKLYTKKRVTLGIFHFSFLAILAGALLTRHVSYEGTMQIRENSGSNKMISSDTYFYARYKGEEKQESVRFSELTPGQFSADFSQNSENIEVHSAGFISGAEKRAVPSSKGTPMIDFVFASREQHGMKSFIFTKGEVMEVSGITTGFEAGKETDIRFFTEDDSLYMSSDYVIKGGAMAGQEMAEYFPGDTISVHNMFLYSAGEFRFLVRNYYPSAEITAVKSSSDTGEDAVIMRIKQEQTVRTVPVFGSRGLIPDTFEVVLGNDTLQMAYGAKYIFLPFSLFLKDFHFERYPGSDSPSSFSSEVDIINSNDKQAEIISMNDPLLYKGYKFFQSSYDRDEKGTILQVNHDLWGTSVTYSGYLLLVAGIFLSLFNRNSYFGKLIKRLREPVVTVVSLIILTCGISLNISAQNSATAGIPVIDKKIVIKFSELWVQGIDGRMEPVSTLNGEIIRKISRKSSLYGKSPDEIVLGMLVYPEMWRTVPLIRVSDETLANRLGISGKYISFRQLFDENGNYRLARDVNDAYNQNPAFRSRLEKEYIYLDERVRIYFMVFQRSVFRLFPTQDRDDKWYSPGAAADEYSGGDSVFVRNSFDQLIRSVSRQNFEESEMILDAINNFQIRYGRNILPDPLKKRVEILYNKVNPFERIFPFYLLTGFLLLLVLFINIFRLKELPVFLKRIFLIIIFLIFIIHTAGLTARWYISGHAPWSNGYESMVYVAWAVMLAGLLFSRRSLMVPGTAAFLSGIALFVAHLNWMNPEITNLVPVLKSYWLMFHVSIITSSYGFLGLSAFLGILVMILIIIRNPGNRQRVNIYIGQLTTINEISAIAGLYCLTVGTFLGAVWANESWGRYWGWDPKETWSLITIVIYSFIVHMRLIPSLKGIFNYNLASIVGFGSVLMTYFGVNYYLAGLHSYGQGGTVSGLNPLVPVIAVLIAAIMTVAYFKDVGYQKSIK